MSTLPNLHPFAVHFPIALFTTAVACDLLLLARARAPWLDRAAVLLYGIAAMSAGVAAITGKLAANSYVDVLTAETNEAVALHGDWAFFTLVLMFVVAGWRFDLSWRDRGENRVRPHRLRVVALLAALVAEGLVLETAARGGALVYRYGVGVEDRGIIRERR